MDYNNDKLDMVMIDVENNTGYLADACIRNNISVDELIDIVDMYGRVIEYLKKQNNSGNLRGLHDGILNELGVE